MIALASAIAGTAQAVDQLHTTAAGGNWSTPATWTQPSDPDTPDYPVSGDTITWGGSHGITLSSNQTFSGGIIPTGGLPDPALNLGSSKLTLDSGVFDNQGSANTIIKGVAGSEFVIAPGADFVYSGSGFYTDQPNIVNNGEIHWTGGSSWQNRSTGGILNNSLIVVSNASGASLVGGSTTGLVNNADATTRVDGVSFSLANPFTDHGGTIEAINGGVFAIGGTGDRTTSTNTLFTTDGSSSIRLGGAVVAFHGSTSGDVALGAAAMRSGYVDFNNEVLLYASGVAATLNPGSGQTLEFRSDVFVTNGTAWFMKSGVGTWRIASNATFTMGATIGSHEFLFDNGVWENDGLVDVIAGQRVNFRAAEGTSIFHNDGTYRVRNANVSWASGSGVFENRGIVEVYDGVSLTIHSGLVASQYYDNVEFALTSGAWLATGTLNLDPANAGIRKIAGSAKVVLAGDGALSEMTGNLMTNSGTLGMHSGAVYNVDGGDFVCDGTFEVGLRDSDTHETIVRTGISNAVNVTLTGGAVDVVNIGLTEAGLETNNTFVVMSWTGTRTGAMTLGNTPDDEPWIYTLTHSSSNLILTISLPPAGAVVWVR